LRLHGSWGDEFITTLQPSPSPLELERDFLTNLGIPATLVTIFVSFFFAADIAGALTVIIVYGPRAFFAEGLRIVNWKQRLLSSGVVLPGWGTFVMGFLTLLLIVLSVFVAEFAAGKLRTFLNGRGPSVTACVRLLGGAALLLLSCWLHIWKRVPLMHPTALSPLIGGFALIWKGVAGALHIH